MEEQHFFRYFAGGFVPCSFSPLLECASFLRQEGLEVLGSSGRSGTVIVWIGSCWDRFKEPAGVEVSGPVLEVLRTVFLWNGELAFRIGEICASLTDVLGSFAVPNVFECLPGGNE